MTGDVEAAPTFRRSAGTPKGLARRADLLALVTRDIAEHGLAGFSLRRAAKAAGTTHKVLLYYFADVDDLLEQALLALRRERIDNALAAVASREAGLADRIAAIWPVLEADDSGLRAVDQAIGLAMYDPDRYALLARDAAEQYLPALRAILPDEWSDDRRTEVADLLLAVFRGWLMDWRTTGDSSRIRSASVVLARWLEAEASTI